MFASRSNKLTLAPLVAASCAIVCLALLASAQYNTYDSESSSDNDGGQVLSNAELGKLVRGSARAGRAASFRKQREQEELAASRNLYNRQQALQLEPTQHNRRQYGASDDSLAAYNPLGTAASSPNSNSNSNADDDDDNEASNFGANFGANFDTNDNDADQANGPRPMNLNQAASGYPGQGEYSEGAGFNFNAGQGYGPEASEGAEYGPSMGFTGDGRRAKSASSLMGASSAANDEDAGAPLYGPNSAVNSGADEDESRAGYAPESNSDNDNDDE